MNAQNADSAVRPGVAILLACALLAVIASFGIYLISKPKPAGVINMASMAETRESAPVKATVKPVTGAAPTGATPLEVQWGIEVASVGIVMDGYAVDLRFKVVAPEKAASLAEGTTLIYLIDQATGTKVTLITPAQEEAMSVHTRARRVRQLGSFPPSPSSLVAGKINSIVFPNREGILKVGSSVAVVVGDYRADNIIVQ